MAFLTPASLSATRNYVRNLALERQPDVGLITDSELTDIVNIAARTLFLRIATKYPEPFAQRSAASVAVAASSIVPFTAISAAGGPQVFRVLNALVGPTGTPEIGMFHVNPFDRLAFRRIYEPTAFNRPSLLPVRFYVEGTNVIFTPVIGIGFDARFQWVQMPADMVGDSDTIWNGLLPMYHDTVALYSLQLVLAKDASGPQSFAPLFQYLDTSLADNFGPPAQANPYKNSPAETRP